MNQTNPKMIIILRDGKVDWVYSDSEIHYAIVDYDRRGTGENPVVGVFEADVVQCDPKEVFNPPRSPDECSEDLSEYGRIYQQLVSEDF